MSANTLCWQMKITKFRIFSREHGVELG